MNNSTDCTDFFTQNTDITGIGTRLAFYLQVIIVVVQMRLQEEEGWNAFWTLASMSFGLMLAAVVSAAQHQLSFFNAYQVQNLVCLANCALVSVAHAQGRMLANDPFRKKKIREKMLSLFYWIQCILAGSLLVTLWAIGEKFGLESSCIPSMHFYVAYWRIYSSNPFHSAKAAAFATYVLLILVGMLANLLIRQWFRGRVREEEANGSTTIRDRWIQAQSAAHRTQPLSDRPDKVQSWVNYVAHFFIGANFFLPPIELSLRQNSQPASVNAQWTFGQILALVAVTPCLVSLIITIADFKAERAALRAKAREPYLRDDAERGVSDGDSAKKAGSEDPEGPRS
ncbi:uncharacterized protein PHACADRAFT_187841 [Phanerochaete carnosa HHB-10118-sp]|uniref:Uncharacterized protein n=1 Tax=Phanerochaete carnosa (strain HHB-10118-sp) TaxID=650164 RepID=K5VX07_PHACS|nr:uncharacterized protein PHACADRAFT_187841 [Phanerochaete carnosa HHB-10118-sp]EKM51305.1 hypothetical protein PHACADRAFT_187841 [Phanerochaete carnosa HHB-10118-sp]